MSWIDLKQPTSATRPCRAGAPSAEPGDGARQRRHEAPPCATLLAAIDVHPRVAMRILHHAQIDVTTNVYTEVSDAKTLQALKRLGKQLDS